MKIKKIYNCKKKKKKKKKKSYIDPFFCLEIFIWYCYLGINGYLYVWFIYSCCYYAHMCIHVQAGSSSPVSSISGFSEIQDEGGKVNILNAVTDHMMLVYPGVN